MALITGHSLSKKVPVLQGYYLHKRPDRIRVQQARGLVFYRPSVELPKYQAGQFKERLRDKVLPMTVSSRNVRPDGLVESLSPSIVQPFVVELLKTAGRNS